MQRSYRSHLFAVSASLAVCFTAPAVSAQRTETRQGLDPIMYVDIVVPFTLRDLHPSVISVFPSCSVGLEKDRSKQQVWFGKRFSAVIGEDRVSYLTKETNGSYSGTLTERLAVEVPKAVAGMPGAFMCQIGVKALGGITMILEHDPKGTSKDGGPSSQKRPSPYPLAPNTPDRVEGQFTW